jgi:hypothetical protein
MSITVLKKVLTSVAVAALFLVPTSFVVLNTSTNQAKKAKAYSPYSIYDPYFNSQYSNEYQQYNNFVGPFDSYNSEFDAYGNEVAVSDFDKTVFDINGNYSYSEEYQADTNCTYYFADNCSNFPFTSQPDYGNFVEQEPYILNVPEPKTYNYYNPYQQNLQDPLRSYPEQDFNYDNGYYNS